VGYTGGINMCDAETHYGYKDFTDFFNSISI
jgi:hypothetical protein